MLLVFQYEKLVLTKSQRIIKVEFTQEGRKIPLVEIRQKMLQKQTQFLRAQGEEEYSNMSEQVLKDRLGNINESSESLSKEQMKAKLKKIETSRHLLVWLDNSTVANHGYLVCLVTCLYDPAVYLTNDEYKVKTGRSVDVQTLVETPEVHFIARCGSSDKEQLTYIETRMQCIKGLHNNIKSTHNELEYTDQFRLCHGDSPLRAFEAGKQKGGNYFCSCCGIHCSMADELDHVLNIPITSLQERKEKVLCGTVAKERSCQQHPKPFENRKKSELENELGSREIYEGDLRPELDDLLVKELKGIQRVPALLFNEPEASLEELGLHKYDILPAEPLHDIVIELVNHITDAEANFLRGSIKLCLGNKDSKRTVDYSAALVKITGLAHQTEECSPQLLSLLDTLVEIQKILYLPEEARCPAIILRYYNQVWYHAILLKEMIPNPKKLTQRKLYGTYFHNLFAHAGLMLRIISGQAAHAEDQERIFNHLKRITKMTSNYRPGHLIPNMLVRLQAEKELGNLEDSVSSQQSHISKLAKCLPPLTNTRIPLYVVRKHSRERQAHLQQISDFLLEGKDKWWSKDDKAIEFYDVYKLPPSDITDWSISSPF